ncbi:DUF4129 domain-containing protein [Natrialba swarupiae]|uniref:DUF4129 domain-containing protein n=1 Tax=Natrialba swarupiae TaxID=2448032 RepID=A0A5D5AMZ1_9EURY|nr:DUF4129 domain-containing protein [Natrialba swarupiae]TYT62454.1 DUF4129 domain-containing protein [Natrialba swarupiae]
MSRARGATRLVVAILGIAAVAIAAATISSTVEYGGDGDPGEVGPEGIPVEETGEPALEMPLFLELLVVALVILAVAVVVWYLVTQYEVIAKRFAVAFVLLLLTGAFVYLLGRLGVLNPEALESPPPPPEGTPGDGDPGDGEGTQQPFPIGPLFFVITALAVGLAVALAWTGGKRRAYASEEGADGVDEAPTEQSHAAVGAAAGRAAERIETSRDVDNEIYRAWLEMTRPLEVDRPETSTPGEFAGAAVEAGLAREDVDQLTSLFEDVRYGHAETTDEMESRAIAVLRRIEDEYADVTSESIADAGPEFSANVGPEPSVDASPDSTDDAGLESPSEDEPGDRR